MISVERLMQNPKLKVETGPGNIIHVHWSRGIRVEDQDAEDLLTCVGELADRKLHSMLVDLNAMTSLSSSAFRIFAQHLEISKMALVGSSAVDQMLATFFLGVHDPLYPTEYFTSAPDAVRWLGRTTLASPSKTHNSDGRCLKDVRQTAA